MNACDEILIDNVRTMAKACELLRRECEVAGISPIHYRQMAGALWDFIDHTRIPEVLWSEMRSICPSVFNAVTLELVPESHFTDF